MRRALLLILASCGGARAPAAEATRTLQMSCRGHVVNVEIAADEATRGRGLMFRRSLDPDAGMLFVFPNAHVASFWMKDTYVPLSIAFLDDNGRIVNLADMAPFDEQTMHRSEGFVRFALEVNRGWFALHSVGPGDSCDLRGVDLPN